MRTNNFSTDMRFARGAVSGGKREKRINLLKFLALAVCFVTVFALVLAFGNRVKPAYADWETSSEGKEKNDYGAGNPFFGDHGDISAVDLKYPYVSSGTSFSYDETFNNVGGDSDKLIIQKTGGDTALRIWTGTNGTFRFGTVECYAEYDVAAALNIQVPALIRMLAANGHTVTAKLSYQGGICNADKVGSNGTLYCGGKISASRVTSSSITHKPTDNGGGSSQINNDSNGTWVTRDYSYTFTLAKDTVYIIPMVSITYQHRTGITTGYANPEGRIINLKISYSVSLKNPSLSSNSTYYDGGAPVVVSDFPIWKDSSTLWNNESVYTANWAPYRTSADFANRDKFEVWYPEIQSELEKKLDTPNYNETGKILLQSYTSTVLGDLSKIYSSATGSYYKLADVTFADTYNYYNRQGYSVDVLKEIGSTARNYVGVFGKYLDQGNAYQTGQTSPSSGNTTTAAGGVKKIEVSVTETDSLGGQTTVGSTQTISCPGASGTSYAVIKSSSGTTYAVVKVEKTSRGLATVTVYAAKNATFKITAYDFGESTPADYGYANSVSKTIEFGGIDTAAPSASSYLTFNDSDAYLALNLLSGSNVLSSKQWRRVSSLSAEPNTNSTANSGAPLLWFVHVTKSTNTTFPQESLDKLPEYKSNFLRDYKQTVSDPATDPCYNSIFANYLAFSQSQMSSFSYDFANGTANGKSVYGDKSAVTGCGYYRFAFYVADFAGNISSSPKTYYVKVDYDPASLNAAGTNISFDGGEAKKISAAENGAWITATSGKFNIAFTAPNISGNTVTFGIGEDDYSVQISGGNATLYKGNDAVGGMTLDLPSGLGDNKNAKLTISYRSNVLSFDVSADDGTGNSFAVIWKPAFVVYTGVLSQANIEEDNYDNPNVSKPLTEIGWDPCTNILIDARAPGKPTVLDETASGAFVEGAIYDFAALLSERLWYTVTWTMNATFHFDDGDAFLADDDYGSMLKIHYGVKVVTNAEQLGQLRDLNIEALYKTITSDNFSTYFDKFVTKEGPFEDDLEGQSEDLIQTAGVGLRVFYVWAEDQAGNKSDLQTYRMFVDWNTYSVRLNVYKDSLLSDLTCVSGSFGDSTTTLKRGAQLNLTLDYETGFVPFKMFLGGHDGVVLLDNFSQQSRWTLRDADYKSFFENIETINAGEGDGRYSFDGLNDPRAITLHLDTPDFGQLPTASGLTVEYTVQPRLVVSFQTEANANYTAKPADPAITLHDETLSDELTAAIIKRFLKVFKNDGGVMYFKDDASEDIRLKFTNNFEDATKDDDGNATFFAPYNRGKYTLLAYFPYDDEAVVAANFNMPKVELDPSCTDPQVSSQIPEEFSFEILQGNVTVTPDGGNSVYGDKVKLTFKITDGATGAVISDEAIRLEIGDGVVGTLKLDGVEGWSVDADGFYNGAAKLAVRQYTIVQDKAFSLGENFNVTFVSNVTYIITAKSVNIYVMAATKAFGDPDPHFMFGARKSDFEGMSDDDIKALLKEMLGDAVGEIIERTEADGQTYLVSEDTAGRIQRQEGENVAQYNFSSSASRFEVNSNYSLGVQSNSMFTITKRTVKLNVSGHQVVLAPSQLESFDPSSLSVDYALSREDNLRLVANEVAKLFEGGATLSIDPSFTPSSEEGFKEVRLYNILLGGLTENENVKLTIGEGDEIVFVVKFAGEAAVIITLRRALSFAYGVIWNNDLIKFSAELFELTGLPEGKTAGSVTWQLALSGNSEDIHDGGMLNANTYNVNASDVHIFDESGEEIPDLLIVVSPFRFTVTKAVVSVRPTIAKTNRVYGGVDADFGIGFEIASVNGETVDDKASFSYAGKSYAEILALVSGNFGRGRFREDGTPTVISQWDCATDDLGNCLDGTNDYYALTIALAFAIRDNNFSVEVEGEDNLIGTRLVINPLTVNLDVANFVGISKTYDGTVNALYKNNKLFAAEGADLVIAYDFNSIVLNSDDVYLVFEAAFEEAGSMTEPVYTSIRFKKLAIEGSKAYNYVLGKIYNSNKDNEAEIYDGDRMLDQSEAMSGIDISDIIEIIIKYINNKADASEKERIVILIGNLGLRKQDITVSKMYDGSTSLTIANISIGSRPDDGSGSPNVLATILMGGAAQLIAEHSTRFAGSGVSSTYIVNLEIFFPIEHADGFNVINLEGSDVTIAVQEGGFLVTIVNLNASIVKRKLNAASFVADSVFAESRDYNSKTSVDVNFSFADGALAPGDSAASVGLTLKGDADSPNAGNHTVTLSDASDVRNKNYELDIEALRTYFLSTTSLTVDITRAKLVPNVTFNPRAYNGSAELDEKAVSKNSGYEQHNFTTVFYSTELEHELERIKIVGEPTYILSDKGAADPNVAFDAQGRVILHNVLVQGLQVQVDDLSLLNNYTILGYIYNSSGDSYNPIGEVTTDTYISDYEILNAIAITKFDLHVIDTNVHIDKKVYDGTNTAHVTIDLPGEDHNLPEGAREHIGIVATGNFSRVVVEQNIRVTLSDCRIVADEDFEYLIKNYTLIPSTSLFYGEIIARPVALTGELGTKTYDGNNKAYRPSYSLEGILPEDVNFYNVSSGSIGAFFTDKNVKYVQQLDESNVAKQVVGLKDGAVFNPVLINSNSKISNYVLAEASEKPLEGRTLIGAMDKSGEYFYYEAAASVEAPVKYLYALAEASLFIKAKSENAAKVEEFILGYFEYQNVGYYALAAGAESVEGADDVAAIEALGSVKYFAMQGTVEPKKVYISSDGIYAKDGSTAFTKVFDGTVKFAGEVGKDYDFNQNAIVGAVEGDELSIGTLSAEFNSAGTEAQYVVFSIQSFVGKDAGNYVMRELSTARIKATITKRDVKASLADKKISYGTNVQSVVGDVEYSMGGKKLTLFEGALYVKFAEYLELIGFAKTNKDDVPYINSLVQYTYNLNTDPETSSILSATQPSDGNEGEYIRLIGAVTLPVAKAVFSSSFKPQAGDKSRSYSLVNGSASNYNFEYVYTQTDGSATSVAEIVRRKLLVSTTGTDATVRYGDPLPTTSFVLAFYASDGTDFGFASGESYQSVFVWSGVDHGPVLKWYLYDINSGSATPLSDTNFSLSAPQEEAGMYYVARYEMAAGEDYEASIQNYLFEFGTIGHELLENEEYRFILKYDGSSFVADTSRLTVTEPVVEGVSLADQTERTFTYAKSGTNPIDRTPEMLVGLRAGDTVEFDVTTVNKKKAINVGVYEGKLKVTRIVKWSDSDAGYSAEWLSDKIVRIEITKATPTFYATDYSKEYDGKVYTYAYSGNKSSVTWQDGEGQNIGEGCADLVVEKQIGTTFYCAYFMQGDVMIPLLSETDADGNVTYYYMDGNTRNDYAGKPQSFEIKDAGTYRVVVALNDRFESENPNYAKTSFTASITVRKAIVNISGIRMNGSAARANEIATAPVVLNEKFSENATYNIDYNVAMGDPSNAAALTKAMTKIVFAKEINSAGRYTFRVTVNGQDLNADNYNFVGADGILELTASAFESGNSDFGMRLVDDSGNETAGVIANRLEVRNILRKSGSGADVELWDKVNQYMPYINSKARLAGVVHMDLYCDNQRVAAKGLMELTIKIPESVDQNLKDAAVYVRTPEGGLAKLSDYQLKTAADGSSIVFVTDYLGEVVFVDFSTPTLPKWAVWSAVGAAGAVAAFVLIVVLAYVVRKSKLKKLI